MPFICLFAEKQYNIVVMIQTIKLSETELPDPINQILVDMATVSVPLFMFVNLCREEVIIDIEQMKFSIKDGDSVDAREAGVMSLIIDQLDIHPTTKFIYLEF